MPLDIPICQMADSGLTLNENGDDAMTLCKGCNENEIDARTWSGNRGFCSYTCEMLSELAPQVELVRKDGEDLRRALSSMEFWANGLGSRSGK